MWTAFTRFRIHRIYTEAGKIQVERGSRHTVIRRSLNASHTGRRSPILQKPARFLAASRNAFTYFVGARFAPPCAKTVSPAGSLDLDFPEIKVWLDESGHPRAHPEKVENDISHQLIEEFMLAANEVVALRDQEQASFRAIYRIHEDPDPEQTTARHREFITSLWPQSRRPHHSEREVQKLLQIRLRQAGGIRAQKRRFS